MAVNIDEGEPGTFKDRVLLERDPHRFLEGMLIAAWAVGIDAIYVYLRDEYHGCRALLEAELAALQRAIRRSPACREIVLRRGAGAYICGEESAMIESIEGKRGMPRLRPPYVAQVGLFGRPTLEHNFETLYWVRELLEKGGAWFASHGRNGRKGLRSFSVSGRVAQPGRQAGAGRHHDPGADRRVLRRHAGRPHASTPTCRAAPRAASCRRRMNDIPLDFDTLQPYGCFIGSAAVIVLSDHDSAVGAARNLMRFFEHESCGQCTPCRNGTAKASVADRRADAGTCALLADLSLVMRDASICGLGQAAPNPVDCVDQVLPARARGAGGSPRRNAMNAITRAEAAQLEAPIVAFELNGREVAAPRRRDAAPGRRSRRRRDSAPLLQGRLRHASATAAPAWSRSTASACSRRRAAARRPPA